MKRRLRHSVLFVNLGTRTFLSAIKKGTVRGTTFPEEAENGTKATRVSGRREALRTYYEQAPGPDTRLSSQRETQQLLVAAVPSVSALAVPAKEPKETGQEYGSIHVSYLGKTQLEIHIPLHVGS